LRGLGTDGPRIPVSCRTGFPRLRRRLTRAGQTLRGLRNCVTDGMLGPASGRPWATGLRHRLGPGCVGPGLRWRGAGEETAGNPGSTAAVDQCVRYLQHDHCHLRVGYRTVADPAEDVQSPGRNLRVDTGAGQSTEGGE